MAWGKLRSWTDAKKITPFAYDAPMNIAVMGGAIGQANNCFVRVGKK
jgi:hypothetical protein